MGETPNLAARLQSRAEPGGVLIADATRELAGGLFEYADEGARDMKGSASGCAPGACCARAAWKAASMPRAATPDTLVGRRREIEELARLWQSATQGNGCVAVLVVKRASASRAWRKP